MTKKAIETLRNGLEDSHWYSDDDEKIFNELVIKAKAFDHIENLVKKELTSDDLYNDARNNDYSAGMLRVYERVDYIIDDYESGDYDAKK